MDTQDTNQTTPAPKAQEPNSQNPFSWFISQMINGVKSLFGKKDTAATPAESNIPTPQPPVEDNNPSGIASPESTSEPETTPATESAPCSCGSGKSPQECCQAAPAEVTEEASVEDTQPVENAEESAPVVAPEAPAKEAPVEETPAPESAPEPASTPEEEPKPEEVPSAKPAPESTPQEAPPIEKIQV
jgi:hypothetical protein